MVSKVEYSGTGPASHGDEVTHVPLDVDLATFQTGDRLPRLVHGTRIQETKRSVVNEPHFDDTHWVSGGMYSGSSLTSKYIASYKC